MEPRARKPTELKVEILRGTCLHHLKDIPDQSIDAIVTDPPYGIDLKLRWNRPAGLSIRGDRPGEAHQLWRAFLPHAFRVAKPNTAHLFFGTWKSIWIKELLAEHFEIKGCIVWYKNTWGLGCHLRPRWELIWLCHKGKLPAPIYAQPDVWEHARDHRLNHPCQKPVDLLRRCIRLVAPQGGHILDPFAGIGSTGVAAIEEGCPFTGIELAARYARMATMRLKIARDTRAARDSSNFIQTALKPATTPTCAKSSNRAPVQGTRRTPRKTTPPSKQRNQFPLRA